MDQSKTNSGGNEEDLSVTLFDHLPDETFAKPQLHQNSAVEIDLDRVMKDALANPLHYPPLSQSVFPGDKVAIVLQDGIPQPESVLDAFLNQLDSVNILAEDIVTVIGRRTARVLGFGLSEINESIDPDQNKGPAIHPFTIGNHSAHIQIHDPNNEAGWAYLVANQAGDPVHLNRQLVDADVVLPIGCPTAGELRQQPDCVYPKFSSAAVRTRYKKKDASFMARQEEIQLANDTLGSFFSIQIVVGPGNQIRDVFSGARADAVTAALEKTNQLWEFVWAAPVDLIVATIETHTDDQTWSNFADALITASRISVDDGPIIVWSDLSVKPKGKIRKACLSQFEDSINAKLPHRLQHLAAIINERPVYLRSRLSRNDVEELGLGFIDSATEINRIAEPYKKGLLLRDAHKLQLNQSGVGA